MTRLIPGFTIPIEYPSSDGKPVTQGDVPFRTFHDLRDRMKAWAKAKGGMYYGGGLFVYYQEGDPRVRLAPDGFVAFGVPPDDRRAFKTWEEGTVPTVVFEITHPKTRREDLVTKRAIYQNEWEVDEYFLFDPLEDYLAPSLQGFRRVRGAFQPMKMAKGKLTSRALGLTLERGGERLVLRDAQTGALVFTEQEAEIARLKAEIEALKKKK